MQICSDFDLSAHASLELSALHVLQRNPPVLCICHADVRISCGMYVSTAFDLRKSCKILERPGVAKIGPGEIELFLTALARFHLTK